MRTIHSIFPDKVNNEKKEKDPERMDLLMRTIKAVHSVSTDPTAMTPSDLNRQRTSVEVFSRLVTPPVGVHTDDFTVDGIPCEITKPEFAHRKDVIILYCHGGGYTSGGLGYARILAAKLALHTGIEVVSFEYGLAPENPYPGPINDGMKIWDYLMHQGIGASKVILAGDSAGGNMALEISIRLREEKRLLPGALVLFSPWTDMTITNGSYENYKDKDPMLTAEYVMTVRSAYAGKDADFTDIHLSPLYADFEGFPPTLIQVGSNEVLRDDSEKLYKKLTKANAYAKLEVTQGGWHVFQQMPIPRAIRALDSVKFFIDSIDL